MKDYDPEKATPSKEDQAVSIIRKANRQPILM
jgi:hypothetical protein